MVCFAATFFLFGVVTVFLMCISAVEMLALAAVRQWGAWELNKFQILFFLAALVLTACLALLPLVPAVRRESRPTRKGTVS